MPFVPRLPNLMGTCWPCAAVLAWALAATTPLAADAPTPVSQAIYQRLCTECHGDHGQGVPGRHDEPLAGDWSLEKLTRIIEKTMPEDDPDLCVGDEAADVARYVYDAFYSPTARLSRQSARIELARLTHRQYLESVADLILPTGSSSPPEPDELGLEGEYFRGRGFSRQNFVARRLDPQVHFDFGLESPDPERIEPPAFSVRWRGSLLAEETGDHELIVVAENGFRLWLNDDEEPILDGWVASAGRQEHRATRRLLGGRRYPLRLEFHKSSERSAAVFLQWIPPHGVQEPIPARQLSPDPVDPTLVVTTPFPPDDASVGYERGVAVSRSWDDATTHAAIEVADSVVQRLDALAGTRTRAADRLPKIRDFCRRFVERAFRRPLDPELQHRYVDAWFENSSPEAAVKRIVLLALKSPRFLYPGLVANPPDAYDTATRLSYALWDSLPDAPLLAAAAQGTLSTPDEVRRQAERLLNDPRARSKVRRSLHHWLQVDRIEDLAKDPSLFPGFTPRIAADLRKSLNLFLDDIVWSDRSDFRELLLSEDFPVNDRLAQFYLAATESGGVAGLPSDPGPSFVPARAGSGVRSGVLTHPYLLAAFSYPRSTSPIHRGVFLTRNIVGRALNPPPMAVAFKDSDFDPHLTMRQKVAELTRSEACQTCHSVINPLGFSLEHFDAVGRYRTEDGNHPVDAAADYTTPDGHIHRFSGPRDVAAFAAVSESAQIAFVEQLFHQVVKQPALAYGPDVLNQLRESFVRSGCHIQKLVVEIAVLTALNPASPIRPPSS